MKTLIFFFAVLGALGYLGYSQSPEISRWVDNQLGGRSFDVSTIADNVAETLDRTINDRRVANDARLQRLEQALARVEQRLDALQSGMARTTNPVSEDPGGMTVAERSEALLALAQRMALKAVE